MDLPHPTIPASVIGWLAIAGSSLCALAVMVYALISMQNPIIPGQRKKRLGVLVILALTFLILEVRWIIKPVVFEYDDTYWAVWEIAVFAYFIAAIKQQNRDDTGRHAALDKKG